MIKNFQDANIFLKKFNKSNCFEGKAGLEKSKKNLKHFINKNIKVIHVAGTSGKGSVAYLISKLLSSQGFKVGLHLSPHVLDIRERIQINENLISKKKFTTYLNEITSMKNGITLNKIKNCTYFEVLLALALHTFTKEKVNYIVLETGIGGLFDTTNIFDDKLSVITKIDLDHTNVLGNSIQEIALQKAGIIKSNNIVLSTLQKKEVKKILDSQSSLVNATINYIIPKKIILNYKYTTFDFLLKNYPKKNLKNIKLSLLGKHQAYNCALALATLYKLSNRDKFIVNVSELRSTLKNTRLVGRLEILRLKKSKIIIDGAHNPSKMNSLISTLKILFPKKKFDFLVSFSDNKNHKKMLKIIKLVSNKIFFTSLEAYQNYIDKHGVTKDDCFTVLKEKKDSISYILSQKNDIVITGSFYSISDIYNTIIRNIQKK